MLRIRFHGRGGQGMKTASRILGSAAFHAGLVVQDAPVYGAERRGAPMAAFTRIAHAPILERGTIVQADLVVVADDMLLADPAAQPLAGCAAQCTLLVNSTQDGVHLQRTTRHDGRLLVADFTALALELTQTLVGLSTALGMAAAHLVGLSLADSLAGLTAELDEAQLSPVQHRANLQLAQATYALVRSWEPLQERQGEVTVPATALVEVPFDPPWRAAPSIAAAANSPARHTGSCRQFRPVLHAEHCTRCWVCFVRCPEGAITLDRDDYPVVDYDVCKGCLLCVHECPTHAFSAVKEVR
jgi:pyruvate ferredoxin oxidoreductase gamma subunit